MSPGRLRKLFSEKRGREIPNYLFVMSPQSPIKITANTHTVLLLFQFYRRIKKPRRRGALCLCREGCNWQRQDLNPGSLAQELGFPATLLHCSCQTWRAPLAWLITVSVPWLLLSLEDLRDIICDVFAFHRSLGTILRIILFDIFHKALNMVHSSQTQK